MSAGTGSTVKVLLVEDDEMVRAYAEAVLTTLGYQPLAVDDGSAALRAIDEHRDLRLMVTDVHLPGDLTGPALAAEARRRRPELAVLFASGSVDSSGRSERLADGETVLAKPYRRAELAEKLRLLLGAG